MGRPVLPVYDPHKVRGTRRTQRTELEITLDFLQKYHDELVKRRDALRRENARLEEEIKRLSDLAHSRD